MKKGLFIGLILSVLAGGLYLVFRAPFHFYELALNIGIDSRFLSIRKLPDFLYSPSEFQRVTMVGDFTEDEDSWIKMHFSHFKLPVPKRHPLYTPLPSFTIKENKVNLGFQLVDNKNREISSVTYLGMEKLTFDFKNNLIFQLPLFKKFILKRKYEAIWKDLFTLKLGSYRDVSFMWPGSKKWIETLQGMVYELFILHNRAKFFSLDAQNITFDMKSNSGVVQVNDNETKKDLIKQFRQEIIFINFKNEIYQLQLRSKIENIRAEAYRRRFFRDLEFHFSTPSSSIPLYAEFKKLPYSEKLDTSSLIFLLSAYSHETHKRQFLKEMVFYLERGQADRKILNPIYNFAFKKFGTNLSSDESSIQETEEEKLKRKIEEEESKEDDAIKNTKFDGEEGKFDSKEDKINYFLQKAKDSGENSDEDEKSLTID